MDAEGNPMDDHTKEIREWLDRRFRMVDEQGIYLAHQPIYGFRKGHSEERLVERYVITLQIMKALSRMSSSTWCSAARRWSTCRTSGGPHENCCESPGGRWSSLCLVSRGRLLSGTSVSTTLVPMSMPSTLRASTDSYPSAPD